MKVFIEPIVHILFLTDFELPDEIIKVGNTMNSNGGQTLPHWVLMKKKSWLFSIFFHTWSEPDKLLHFYFCRWHGTKRRYDDHEKGMLLLLLLLGMQEKFYKRRWLPFGIHMKRIIGLGTLLLCRLFRIINMAADSLRTTTNSMFELFINFQHSSILRSRRK